jgi:hypothetical protein
MGKKICLLCFFWEPEGKVRNIIRHGGKCSLSKGDTRLNETCWGWRVCSPSQLEKRKKAGLIEEVEVDG